MPPSKAKTQSARVEKKSTGTKSFEEKIVDTKSAGLRLPIPEAVQLVIVFLPVLVSLIYIHTFAVDLPYMDQWALAQPLVHMEAGHLEWGDIYRQHNEAIVAIPMVLTLVLAKLTRYDVVAEAYLAYACLVGSLMVLFAFFRRIQRTLPLPTLAFLPISAIFLGWRGHEGLLWGAALNINLGLMLLLLAIWAVMRATETARFIWLAIVLAIIAVFSFASGHLVWPIGLGILLFPTQGSRSRRLILLWTAVGVATTAVYFNGYIIHQVPWPTGFGYVLANPVQAALYTLIYTGSALGATPSECGRINAVMILIFLPVVWTVARNSELRKVLRPFTAVISLLLLTVPLLLNSRLGLGIGQPYNASRYASMAALWPVGIYVFLLALACHAKPWRYVLLIYLVLLCFGLVGGYREGLAFARLDYQNKTVCRQVLKDYRRNTDLTCFFPNVEVSRRFAFFLDQYNLSVFRERRGPAPAGR